MLKALKKILIHSLGGFYNLDEAIVHISKLETGEKHRVLTLYVKKLYNTLSADDILKEDSTGQWMFMGKQLSEARARQLVSQAKQFLNSDLWEVLQSDIKYQANKKMFVLAENELHLATGKLWLYTLDVIKTRLTSMSNASPLFNVNGKK